MQSPSVVPALADRQPHRWPLGSCRERSRPAATPRANDVGVGHGPIPLDGAIIAGKYTRRQQRLESVSMQRNITGADEVG